MRVSGLPQSAEMTNSSPNTGAGAVSTSTLQEAAAIDISASAVSTCFFITFPPLSKHGFINDVDQLAVFQAVANQKAGKHFLNLDTRFDILYFHMFM
jgi:hypothetical protein